MIRCRSSTRSGRTPARRPFSAPRLALLGRLLLHLPHAQRIRSFVIPPRPAQRHRPLETPALKRISRSTDSAQNRISVAVLSLN
jgi:hypothetical protein